MIEARIFFRCWQEIAVSCCIFADFFHFSVIFGQNLSMKKIFSRYLFALHTVTKLINNGWKLFSIKHLQIPYICATFAVAFTPYTNRRNAVQYPIPIKNDKPEPHIPQRLSQSAHWGGPPIWGSGFAVPYRLPTSAAYENRCNAMPLLQRGPDAMPHTRVAPDGGAARWTNGLLRYREQLDNLLARCRARDETIHQTLPQWAR